MPDLDQILERSIVICAQRSTVFRFFTDPERFARWWGSGSTIDPRPGGEVLIVYPNGVRASGHVRAIERDRSIVFTYGYESGEPIGPGSSEVTITLADHDEGTRVELRHALSDSAVRDRHIQGWRHQMALFATVAAVDQHTGLDQVVDRLFAAWAEPDGARRRALLEECVTGAVRFADRYGCVAGIDELDGHIAAVQAYLPGSVLTRVGPVRHCQGIALADWRAGAVEREPLGTGTNVFELSADSRIRRITGLWAQAPGGT